MTDVNVVLQVLVSGCLMGLVYALIGRVFSRKQRQSTKQLRSIVIPIART